jgi:hypothetical protein
MGLAGLVALLLFAVDAQAAPRLRLSPVARTTAGARVTVKLRGPRTGRLRVYMLTRTRVRRGDKPVARGWLKRGKLTLHPRVPARARTYRMVACLDKPKQCTGARILRVRARPVAPAAPAPAVVATPAPLTLPDRPAANPRTLPLKPDTTRAASARIGPAGGTLTATDANGVQFRLIVPTYALAGAETITMTPAAFGVVLGPAGLGFLRDADLLVIDGSLPDLGRVLAFGARPDGSEAHLVPLTVDDQAVHIALRHLGFYGATTADAAAVRAQLGFAPTAEEELAEQRIAGAQALYMRGESSAAQADAETASALARWRAASLEPDLRGAVGFETATIEFLAWRALGTPDATLSSWHASALDQAMAGAYARCTAGEYTQAGRLLMLVRLAGELGYPVDDGPLMRCGRFEVDRVYRYTQQQSPTDGFGSAYTTRVSGLPIAYHTGDLELEGSAPLVGADWSVHGSSTGACSTSWANPAYGAPGSVALALELPSNLGDADAPVAVRLTGFTSATLRYDVVSSCNDTVTVPVSTARGAERVELDTPVHTSHDEPIFGSPGAFDRTTEETTVAVRHTPSRP